MLLVSVQNEDPFKIHIRMLFVCTRMLLEKAYVTRMYPYVPVCSVCYDIFYTNNPRVPTNYLKEMLRLILQENSVQFIGKDYLQIHGTAMGTKMAASFLYYTFLKKGLFLLEQEGVHRLLVCYSYVSLCTRMFRVL